MKTAQAEVKIGQDICDTTDAEVSFNDTLKVLGNFWVLRILSALEERPQRFCELERTLKNSNPVTLTKKLKVLEEHKFVERHSEPSDKQSICYGLTEKGHATLPVIEALKQFSSTHA